MLPNRRGNETCILRNFSGVSHPLRRSSRRVRFNRPRNASAQHLVVERCRPPSFEEVQQLADCRLSVDPVQRHSPLQKSRLRNFPKFPHLSRIHSTKTTTISSCLFKSDFYGDPHRWDASRRDQFIILGMLASEGGYGVRQGKLVHHLGMGLSPGSTRGSNAVRAAKIALTRLANPHSITLFAPAAGHGTERIHAFADEYLADVIARYALNHEAAVLLPASAAATFAN